MTDRELLEIILQKIGDMNSRMNGMDSRMVGIETNMATKDELMDIKAEMADVKTGMTNIKAEIVNIKADVKFTREAIIRIENDHGQKLGALFDGYKLNSEKLERIESEVSKHEEIILRRIR